MAGRKGAGPSKTLTESGLPPRSRRGCWRRLLEADPRGTTPRVVAWLGRLAPDQFSAAAIVLARVLELRGAPGLLASARTNFHRPYPADLAKLCVRQVRASGRDEPGLDRLARKGGPAQGGAQETVRQGNEPASDRRRRGPATLRGARSFFAART